MKTANANQLKPTWIWIWIWILNDVIWTWTWIWILNDWTLVPFSLSLLKLGQQPVNNVALPRSKAFASYYWCFLKTIPLG